MRPKLIILGCEPTATQLAYLQSALDIKHDAEIICVESAQDILQIKQPIKEFKSECPKLIEPFIEHYVPKSSHRRPYKYHR